MIEINEKGEISRFGENYRIGSGKFKKEDENGKFNIVKFGGLKTDYTIDDSLEAIINSYFIITYLRN